MSWKFEYVLALIVLLVLASVLGGAFAFGYLELINTIVVALVAAFSGIIGFFFTKHNPNDPNDPQK